MGGAIAANNNCSITSEKSAVISFINNSAGTHGGAMSLYIARVTFESSIITINNNSANKFGGALHILENSDVIIKGNSLVNFSNNVAIVGGAAIFSQFNSNIKMNDNSIVTFNSNNAPYGSGTIYLSVNCYVFFEHSSVVMFANNFAGGCGAIICHTHSHIHIIDSSSVTFSRNGATEQNGKGGALCVNHNSDINIRNNSMVILFGNSGRIGGAVYIETTSYLLIDGTLQYCLVITMQYVTVVLCLLRVAVSFSKELPLLN